MNRYRDNMKAIVTKFHGPTNHKGSRISATAEPKHRKAAAERQVSADELPNTKKRTDQGSKACEPVGLSG